MFASVSSRDVQTRQEPSFSVKKNRIQAKLKVSQPGDIYEQEADHVAEQVMSMPENTVQRKCSSCEMKTNDEMKIHRKSDSIGGLEVSDNTSSEISNIRSTGGSPLDGSTRDAMESRFGFDFGNVRIHADDKAARSAESVNARAYTVGNDIVFGKGEYSSQTNDGQKLLAHELTHVVQQGDEAMNGKIISRSPQFPGNKESKDKVDNTSTGKTTDMEVFLNSKNLAITQDKIDKLLDKGHVRFSNLNEFEPKLKKTAESLVTRLEKMSKKYESGFEKVEEIIKETNEKAEKDAFWNGIIADVVFGVALGVFGGIAYEAVVGKKIAESLGGKIFEHSVVKIAETGVGKGLEHIMEPEKITIPQKLEPAHFELENLKKLAKIINSQIGIMSPEIVLQEKINEELAALKEALTHEDSYKDKDKRKKYSILIANIFEADKSELTELDRKVTKRYELLEKLDKPIPSEMFEPEKFEHDIWIKWIVEYPPDEDLDKISNTIISHLIDIEVLAVPGVLAYIHTPELIDDVIDEHSEEIHEEILRALMSWGEIKRSYEWEIEVRQPGFGKNPHRVNP